MQVLQNLCKIPVQLYNFIVTILLQLKSQCNPSSIAIVYSAPPVASVPSTLRREREIITLNIPFLANTFAWVPPKS
jgi:hypothetical protein